MPTPPSKPPPEQLAAEIAQEARALHKALIESRRAHGALCKLLKQADDDGAAIGAQQPAVTLGAAAGFARVNDQITGLTHIILPLGYQPELKALQQLVELCDGLFAPPRADAE